MLEPKLIDGRWRPRAAHGQTSPHKPASPLVGLLADVRPKLKEMLERYGLPEPQAEAILRATLQALVWKWESVRNREDWLLAVVERKCRLAAAARGTLEER